MEKTFWNTNCSEIERMNERQKPGKTPCAWCKRLWRAFDAVPAGNSRASSGFSAGHIIPLSGCIHRKAINRLFPAGTASYLWIHQVQSHSNWAAVRRSRWRIHRATIERFISVYRLEENGSLLKVPLSGCIHRKAINKTFSRQEPHLICEFIKCKAAATEP